MEEELFLSGYCRQIDGSRMVTALLESGSITEVDCCYFDCIYHPNCQIGKTLDSKTEDGSA